MTSHWALVMRQIHISGMLGGEEFSTVGAFLTTARPEYSLHSIMLRDPEVKSWEISRLLACDGVGGVCMWATLDLLYLL